MTTAHEKEGAMKKISVSELKKTILAAEAERLKIRLPFRPEGAKLDRTRKAAERMTSRWMKGSGLDLDKLQALHEQRDTELQRLAATHKKEGLRLVARRKNKLEITAQGKALSDLAGKTDFFPNPFFSLDTPFLIWSTPLLSLDSSAAPFNSWAKFRFLTSLPRGTQKVSFYFSWVNAYSDYAVINAATSLSASGYLRTHAPWGLSTNQSLVQAEAWFGLWFGVSSDLNFADYVAESLGFNGAYGSFFTGADVESTTISTGVSLSKTMFAVPPGDVVVFEVAVAIDYENDGGNLEADFASGDFQVACPVVVFSLLNSPPGAVMA
jgi:hypothetical protein